MGAWALNLCNTTANQQSTKPVPAIETCANIYNIRRRIFIFVTPPPWPSICAIKNDLEKAGWPLLLWLAL